MEGQTKTELVFIPYPGRGHLMSMLELIRLLIDREERLSVTVLIIKPLSNPERRPYSLESNPRIRFVDIPPTEHPLGAVGTFLPFKFIESHKDHVRNEVARLFGDAGPSNRLSGFVVDVFCTSMADVAHGLGVPTYAFFPSGAATLGLSLHFLDLVDYQNQDLTEYVNSKEEIPSPCYGSPIPTELLPSMMMDQIFMNLGRRIFQAKGIIVNTFHGLESRAMDYLSGHKRAPSLYPVGPVIHVDGEESRKPKNQEIIEWLDRQPDSSVVFLCFGSRGSFDEMQVREIARALENSGHRFLWSLRKPPPPAGGNRQEAPSDYENPAEVLPEGFVERTAGAGKVIGWAPQAAVLAHGAVGGFVSHCGWNSTLESMWWGVPMAAWPMFAEQPLNAFQVARDLGVGVEIDLRYKKGANMVVGAEEIEKGIRRLMEPGGDARVRMEELRAKSRSAVVESGSSYESIGRFIKDVMAHDDVAIG